MFVGTWQIKKICLSCKHYRLVDEMSGLCRLNKGSGEKYPMKLNEDSCPHWKDSGQQYYIRRGWIKSRKNLPKDDSVKH